MNKTIAIDFDGVISDYRGWKGKGNFAPIIPGAKDRINSLFEEGWTIIIHTTRSETYLVARFLSANGVKFNHINKNPENEKLGLSREKPIADVYLDDRAIRFLGSWDENLMKEIKESQPHWRKK